MLNASLIGGSSQKVLQKQQNLHQNGKETGLLSKQVEIKGFVVFLYLFWIFMDRTVKDLCARARH